MGASSEPSKLRSGDCLLEPRRGLPGASSACGGITNTGRRTPARGPGRLGPSEAGRADHRELRAIVCPGVHPLGAWGPGSFDNDDAVDWLNDLRRSARFRPIETALDAVARMAPNTYVEAPEASAAVAAAEVVAALRGRPAVHLPPELREWVGANGGSGLAENLGEVARRALARVEGNSELRDLWAESGDEGASWRRQIDDLMSRLDG